MLLEPSAPTRLLEAIDEKLQDEQLSARHRTLLQLMRFAATRADDGPEAALDVLDEALQAQDVALRHLLVDVRWQTLVSMQRFDEAEKVLRDAIEQLPEHGGELAYALVRVYRMQDDEAGAVAAMEQMIERFPDHPGLNNDLAYEWSLRNKNLERALRMSQIAVQAEPDSEAFLDTMGWVLYKLGRFDEAVEYLRRSLFEARRQEAQAPAQRLDLRLGAMETQVIVADHLGDALHRVGRTDEAIEAWRTALAKYPQGVRISAGELRGRDAKIRTKIAAAEAGQPVPVAELPDPEPAAPQS